MNEIIQIVEWQLILFFIAAVFSGAFVWAVIMPKIEKWLIKFEKIYREVKNVFN